MPQSSTLYVGMDVHKESIAVAYVAQAHGAEVVSSALSEPGRAILISCFDSCSRRVSSSSSSTKLAPAAMGSIAT
jgi:hypothetical protein